MGWVVAATVFVLLVMSLIGNVILGVFVMRYGRMILEWEANINDALDVLDEKHRNLDKILKMPVFVNTPEVQGLLREIEDSRDAVLEISNSLVMPAQSGLHRRRIHNEE